MIRSAVQWLYDRTIREHLPRTIKVYNGVALRVGRLLDRNVVDPEYKQSTIGPLREYTNHDDRVTVVGGGFGVSAVVAAHHATSVVVYEGGLEMVDRVRDTAALNRVEDQIDVRAAFVGDDIDLYGAAVADERVAPSELEACDVLEMDCEGAEETILKDLEVRPRVIIVECHPQFGVDPSAIAQTLEERGYDIVERFEFDKGNVTLTGVIEE